MGGGERRKSGKLSMNGNEMPLVSFELMMKL